MNKCGLFTTFHKDSCKYEYCCNCSEKEGNQIKDKFFQMSGAIEG